MTSVAKQGLYVQQEISEIGACMPGEMYHRGKQVYLVEKEGETHFRLTYRSSWRQVVVDAEELVTKRQPLY